MMRWIVAGSGAASHWSSSKVPAEQDPIGPREHVAGAPGEGIAHLRLRLKDRELAARGVRVPTVAHPDRSAAVPAVKVRRSNNIRSS
jgi:hypothetical protein